jgi:hypothetical protein
MTTARDNEAALIARCLEAAQDSQATARDQREALVFRMGAMVTQSEFPAVCKHLLTVSDRYYAAHPGDRLEAVEVIHRGWIESMPRFRDPLTHELRMQEADRVGPRTALSILEKWSCSAAQKQAILQLSNGPPLSDEQRLRISHVLTIHAALRLLFSNPENVYGFMGSCNGAPPFCGRSPLELIGSGDLTALEQTAEHISSLLAPTLRGP